MDAQLAGRGEVLLIEAQAAVGRGQKARAGEHDRVGELLALPLADERQPGAHLGHFAGVVDELVLPIAQAGRVRVAAVEQEVVVILPVVGHTHDLDGLAFQRAMDDGVVIQRRLHLHLEALQPLDTRQQHQLVIGAGLALDDEGVDLLGHGDSLIAGGGLVHGQQHAVAHQPAAVAQHVGHVAALAAIDDARVDGVGVVVEVGLVVDAGHVAHGDVGPLARLQAARQMAHVDGPRPADGGDLQRLAGGQGGRVLRRHFGNERRQAHLLDHVQVVVAGRAVGAHADLQAQLEHLGDGGDAAGQLQVAGRAVGHARADAP